MKKFLTIAVMLVMVCFASQTMALDQSACAEFPHNWTDIWICPPGPDGTPGECYLSEEQGITNCIGKYELSDMGTFDANGTWVWNQSFIDEMTAGNPFSPWHPNQYSFDTIEPVNDPGVRIGGFKIDNHDKLTAAEGGSGPNPGAGHRVTMDDATKARIFGPSIWKMETNTFGSGMIEGYHVDVECHDNCDDPASMAVVPIFETASFISLPMAEVDHFELKWPDGTTESLAIHHMETANYHYMSWNTGNNALQEGMPWTFYETIYSEKKPGLLTQSGDYEVTVYFNNGADPIGPAVIYIPEYEVMPKVATTYEYQVERVNKSGKHILTGQTVVADNLTAREVNGQLIIQFAEPDGAFTVTTSPKRLRFYVGILDDPYLGSILYSDFLWMDVPLHTGTVVIPEAEWSDMKVRAAAKGRTEVTIGGMYRQQFDVWPTPENGYDYGRQYHNRGYIDSIYYTF